MILSCRHLIDSSLSCSSTLERSDLQGGPSSRGSRSLPSWINERRRIAHTRHGRCPKEATVTRESSSCRSTVDVRGQVSCSEGAWGPGRPASLCVTEVVSAALRHVPAKKGANRGGGDGVHSARSQGEDASGSMTARLEAGTLGQLGDLPSPPSLVDLIWACATLGLKPGQAWWEEAYLTASHSLHLLTASQLASLLWSLARLGLGPSRLPLAPLVLSTLVDLHPPSEVGPQLSPVEISAFIWSVAKLGIGGGPLTMGGSRRRRFQRWLQGLLREGAAPRLHEYDRIGVLQLTHSLALVKVPVNPEFVNLLALAALARLEGMSASELAALIIDLGRLGTPIGWKTLCAMFDHLKTVIPGITSPKQLSSLVWAIYKVCLPTPQRILWKRKHLLMVLAERSVLLMPNCSPWDLVRLVAGFTSLGFYPGATWMKLHRECCIKRKDKFSSLSKQRVRAAYQTLLTSCS